MSALNRKLSKNSLHHQDFDKYKYVRVNPFWVKVTYTIGIITWLLSILGYIIFLNLSWVYWIVFGPFVFILSLDYLLDYGINLLYKKFDLKKHIETVRIFVAGNDKPSVDILLPICGESSDILERTWNHVSKLDYPNFKVYVLDDKADKNAKKMCESFGFTYLSRPNRGETKKAGNLKYGFERSNGEYIIIFDADFAPIPEFINETIPYLIKDQKIGILQTPQYFEIDKSTHDRSWLEYGAAASQEGFYKIIQPSRNEVGGAICVGTNAAYRRSALDKIGGTAQIEHSEDVWTGVMLLNQGYKVVYKAIILAEGFCPEDHTSFFSQQYRWCKGSMSLMTNKLFWSLPIPFKTKLTYISGFLHYISSIFTYYSPAMAFVIFWNHLDNIKLENSIPFVPWMIFSFILVPLTRSFHPRTGVFISGFASFTSHSLALVHTIFRKNMEWVPTGSSVTMKNYWFNFVIFANFSFLVGCLWFILIAFNTNKLTINNYNYWILIFWLFLNMFNIASFLINAIHDTYLKKV